MGLIGFNFPFIDAFPGFWEAKLASSTLQFNSSYSLWFYSINSLIWKLTFFFFRLASQILFWERKQKGTNKENIWNLLLIDSKQNRGGFKEHQIKFGSMSCLSNINLHQIVISNRTFLTGHQAEFDRITMRLDMIRDWGLVRGKSW